MGRYPHANRPKSLFSGTSYLHPNTEEESKKLKERYPNGGFSGRIEELSKLELRSTLNSSKCPLKGISGF